MRKTLRCVLILAILLACREKPAGSDVPALIADLKSGNPEAAGKANLALVRIGEPAVPALVELLSGDDVQLRGVAAATLWAMGPKAKAAVPALAAALSDADLDVRLGSAMALEAIGPDAKDAVPALIRALKDKEGRVRQWAAKALGKIGPAARQALPALAEASKLDGIRPAAEEAIGQIKSGQPAN